MAKIDITKIDLTELISLEKAANIICKNYENLIKMYDGSINKNIKDTLFLAKRKSPLYIARNKSEDCNSYNRDNSFHGCK